MSLQMPERLYSLLPAVYRQRDFDQGEPLRALLGIIEAELERVEEDTARLYDDWFIETCGEWVVPYIGDLLGVRPIRPVASAAVSARAYVANTIAYRRRKGTAVVLEELARDVTGWPAQAVEFFQRLATTQNVNHVRPSPAFTAGVRDAAAAELADGPFEPFGHTAEVRRIATRGGRYNIPDVGLFLWRLKSYPVGAGLPGDEALDFASARDLGAWWSVHPAGVDTPLFNVPRTETTITHLAEEENVPGQLRALALYAELERLRAGAAVPPRFLTDEDPAFRVFVRLAGEAEPVAVPREQMYVCRIPDDVALASPAPLALAVDPARGRLGFAAGLPVAEVRVQSSYGFSGDLGGGPYDRSAAVAAANAAIGVDVGGAGFGGFDDPGVWQVGVSRLLPDDGSGTLQPSLRAAVAAWHAQPDGTTGVIVVLDSMSDMDGGGPLEIWVGEGSRLLVVAGVWPLEPIPGAPPGSVRRVPGHSDAQLVRAHVVGDIVVRGTAPDGSAAAGACFLNGLLIEGTLTVAPGTLGQLAFSHGTLVPGLGGVRVAPGNEQLALGIDHVICGAVTAAGPVARLQIADSLIGGEAASPGLGLDAPEAAVELLRSTVWGGVRVQSVSASDCIFAAPLAAARRQVGCVRFSYVAPGSAAPRRYRCQPELEQRTRVAALREAAQAAGAPPPTPAEEAAVRAEAAAAIRPLFVSRRYGDPGFSQLELRCAVQIRTGAESGAEMGAFEFLRQPQREANLRDALAEYLQFGLEAGLFFIS